MGEGLTNQTACTDESIHYILTCATSSPRRRPKSSRITYENEAARAELTFSETQESKGLLIIRYFQCCRSCVHYRAVLSPTAKGRVDCGFPKHWPVSRRLTRISGEVCFLPAPVIILSTTMKIRFRSPEYVIAEIWMSVACIESLPRNST
jgi:hypothetical protein